MKKKSYNGLLGINNKPSAIAALTDLPSAMPDDMFRWNISELLGYFDYYISSDEVTKYLTWPTHSNIDVSKSVLGNWADSYSDKKYYQWAIVLKANGGEPVGSISVVKMDEDVSMVQIGYCIGRPWWKKGITSEAMKMVMDFFFDKVKVNRIESRHDPRNPNSGKVMIKCGMKYEGTLRSSGRNNQGICDVCYYSLLKSER